MLQSVRREKCVPTANAWILRVPESNVQRVSFVVAVLVFPPVPGCFVMQVKCVWMGNAKIILVPKNNVATDKVV